MNHEAVILCLLTVLMASAIMFMCIDYFCDVIIRSLYNLSTPLAISHLFISQSMRKGSNKGLKFTQFNASVPLFTLANCLLMFTSVYLCSLLFNLVYSFLPFFTHVTIVYPCLPLVTHVYPCLPMFTNVHSCLPGAKKTFIYS